MKELHSFPFAHRVTQCVRPFLLLVFKTKSAFPFLIEREFHSSDFVQKGVGGALDANPRAAA
jgi:hypothetical protein